MILETPQYEASVDWLVSLYRRTGSSPSEILLDLLKHDPGELMPGLLDRAPGYISDMLALGRIGKKAVWAAASRIAQQKPLRTAWPTSSAPSTQPNQPSGESHQQSHV